MASKQTIAEMMLILHTAYPHYRGKKDTARVYAELLADIPDDLLIAGAKAHASTGKFFPSVAELREAAFDLQARAQGIPNAAEAWGEVMHQVRNVGSYGRPEFSAPLIYSAVDALGGWKALCASDNNVADRAHFLKIYGSLQERSQRDTAMLPEVRGVIAEMAEKMRMPQLEGKADLEMEYPPDPPDPREPAEIWDSVERWEAGE